MSAVDALVKKRDSYQKRIVMAQATVVGWPPEISLSIIKLMANTLTQLYDKVERSFSEISEKCSAADFTTDHQPVYETLFGSLESLRGKVMDLQTAKEVAANTSAPSFKLERIKIPSFSGKYNEWQSFEDLFSSSVHNNSKLSGVEKMVHLKSCLVGEAASIISSFPVTATSYNEAWALVKERYSNKREIIFSHIRKFDDLKCIQQESASGLRGIADTVNETIRSLRVEGVPVQHWDLIIIYYSLKKLDQDTKKEWSLNQTTDLPKLDEFVKFLENRARALSDSTIGGNTKKFSSQKNTSTHATEVQDSKRGPVCPKCSESHYLNKCASFLKLSVTERKEFVDKKKLCYNCFNKGHLLPKCKIQFSCRTCGKSHHTLIHEEVKTEQNILPAIPPMTVQQQTTSQSVPPTPAESGVPPSVVGHCAPSQTSSMVVLLGTLVGQVEDSFGNKQDCRIFLDPGSESHFVSENCVDRLGIRRKKTCVSIKGIGDSTGEKATGIAQIRLYSKYYDYSLDINALILRKITGLLPRAQTKANWSHLKDLELADPQYYKPGPIDILLGAQIAGIIMLPGIKRGSSYSPIAQNTRFGWMLSGEVPARNRVSNQYVVLSNHASCKIDENCVETCLRKFWELEEADSTHFPPTEENSSCEEHFVSTHQRSLDGRYIVELPFKQNAPALGSSLQGAIKRFHNVEKRLSKFPAIREEYVKCMQENIFSQFMEEIPPTEINKSEEESYYLPHREVVKESSSTTKVRIVFDASAKTSSGSSLNDVLLTGPKLQVDLVPLLIRFRTHLVAMSADIVKFYPQFGINKNHVDFQLLVWRDSPDLPLQHFRMVRITFGLTCAPFLAIRSLHQLGEDECDSFPPIKSIIKNDFLVDNLLTGASTVEEALDIQRKLLTVMQAGSLKLKKWSSNSEKILQAVPAEDREKNFLFRSTIRSVSKLLVSCGILQTTPLASVLYFLLPMDSLQREKYCLLLLGHLIL